MANKLRRIALAVGAVVLVGGIGYTGLVQYGLHKRYPQTVRIEEGAGLKDQIARGEYIARLSDCTACHTKDGGQPFAGGYKLETPFGAILSSNITSDKETGIGGWTQEQFDRAVRHGVGSYGNLYAAMPYNAYAKLTDQDLTDLWAYIRTIPAVSNKVVENQLPFPFNQRWILAGWNLLFFKDQVFQENTQVSPEVNRGAYLVEGAGHCASCHTAKNLLGGDSSAYLQGGTLQGWFAPDLTPNPHTGLGHWSREDIVNYLRAGTNSKTASSGPMTEAIENSTQYMSESDLHAIAQYLHSLPASQSTIPAAIDSQQNAMLVGKKIYESQCNACHLSDGSGVRNMIPSLAGNAQVNSADASSLLNVVLNGSQGPFTHANPTAAGMPAFAWKLSDSNIADVMTYIRNRWGNAAQHVSSEQVEKARQSTHASEWLGADKN
ncbi:c-type cytochrome [Rosenbergiella epipactidis]|uniref:c-type cytochrome n=1 Tax=Rosenbergiella epipactidis TaxID=1544694 RepID=UPI001BDB1EBC|nr:c-type cytochrome [Rosenbergiella epipactidis]MBT0718965.1 c-type cytochrome [Rosenbergiella epipactidis]